MKTQDPTKLFLNRQRSAQALFRASLAFIALLLMMAEGIIPDLVLNRAALDVVRNGGAPDMADLDRATPSPDFVSGHLWATLETTLTFTEALRASGMKVVFQQLVVHGSR